MKKMVFISGSSRGIGLSVLKKLLKEDYIVIGTSTSDKGKTYIDKTIQEHGGKGLGLVGDLATGKSTIEKWVNEIQDHFGCLPDILVANAGITDDQLTMRMKESQWMNVININLTGSFLLSQAFLRNMVKKRWGRFIFLGSVSACGNPGQINYAASKAGIAGLSRTLAIEYGSRNITSNVVSPGFIQTDMTDAISEDQSKHLLNKIPLGRYGKPEEVAELIAFLSSENAQYISGQTIHINGAMITS